MFYRNAFAHGNISADMSNGVTLNYHSNGHKQDILVDDFWDKLETFFKNSNLLLIKAVRILTESKIHELVSS